MKVQLRNLLLGIVLGAATLFSCKKKELMTDPQPEVPVVVVPPVVEAPARKLIPVQFKTGQSTINFSYTKEHALLQISYDEKTTTEISYTKDGKLNGILRFKDGEMTGVTQLTFNKTGSLIQADHILITENEYLPTGYYTLTYNTSQQINTISYYNEFNKLISQQHRSYGAIGNPDYDVWTIPDMQANYSYDDKNGIFKNVSLALILALEEEHPLFEALLNNRLQLTNARYPDHNQSFSYTYNKDKYPETVTSTLNGKVLTTKITYEAVP